MAFAITPAHQEPRQLCNFALRVFRSKLIGLESEGKKKKGRRKEQMYFFFPLGHHFSESILETQEKHVLIIFTSLSNHPGMLGYIFSLEKGHQ